MPLRRDDLHYILIIILLLLGGCTSIDLDKRQRSATYVGIVRINIPERQGNLIATETKALGIGWDHGPFAGWKADSQVIADPSRCQLLVIIRSTAQADHALQVLQQLRGQSLCIADFTSGSRP